MSSIRAIPFTADCRDCGHAIKKPMPGADFEHVSGIRCRCAACGTTNWLTK